MIASVYFYLVGILAVFNGAIFSYPIAFAMITLPISAVRWRSGFGHGHHTLPSVATFVTEFIYSLSGAVNVLLFLFTRKDLFLPRNRLVAPRPVSPRDQISLEPRLVEPSPEADNVNSHLSYNGSEVVPRSPSTDDQTEFGLTTAEPLSGVDGITSNLSRNGFGNSNANPHISRSPYGI